MTAQPVFDPARKAAIRELLIETVDAGAPVRRPGRVAFISALIGVAVALAGGTTALALSGVLRFGTPEWAPAPMPTPTSSATPTSAPSATLTPARPIVQTTPIEPHDVDSLPEKPRWALDLPGANNGCTLVLSYSLSDGRALYASGMRPKEYEGSDCVYETDEHIALTLVDTENGVKLWTREWTFTTHDGTRTANVSILGTSGRAVISYTDPAIGPHEVVDLATGGTLAPYRPDIPSFRPVTDSIPVNDQSGDLILVQRHTDTEGQATQGDTLIRVDPRDLSHPKWTTQLDGWATELNTRGENRASLPISYYTPSTPSKDAVLDLSTGELISMDDDFRTTQVMRDVLLNEDYGSTPRLLRAYDLTGRPLWSTTLSTGASIDEIVGTGTRPGGNSWSSPTGTGLLVLRDQDKLSLVDQATGNEIWRVQTPDCVGPGVGRGRPLLDTVHNAVVFFSGTSVCSLSLSDGTILSQATKPDWTTLVTGTRNFYTLPMNIHGDLDDIPPIDEAQPGTAYSLSTGKQLWVWQRRGENSFSFDGGYLVSQRGNHLESVG